MMANDVKPADEKAKKIAIALLNLIDTANKLDYAQRNIPRYTGQFTEEDLVAQEQENFNRACDAYLMSIRDAEST